MTVSDTPRCPETHNPGVWPYVSRCVLTARHNGNHVDRHGNEWDGDKNGKWEEQS